MHQHALIECVPNFSEGIDLEKIKLITDAIESVKEVRLLDVDPGQATNRTVVTFVGHPNHVKEAAFRGIAKAAEVLDMSVHHGEHPRMGATDVCPMIPIANISMEETVEVARSLAKRVGSELNIPIYCYESAAFKSQRKNLATVRAGEYEGMAEKIQKPEWKPDFGPTNMHVKAGVTAIGARDFLVAYNVNLNTTSVRRANSVAFDIREKGRIKREGNPITGKIVRDDHGEALREEGLCKGVKAIGWYIEEYGLAQISMNITDINLTSLHEAFEACRNSANKRGLRVTGSELVGLVPKKVMVEAGKFFLKKQGRSTGISERDIIHIAVKSMGLDELAPFDPDKKIIEYQLKNTADKLLVDRTLESFAQETASESPAPGGGSVAAYVGALGAALANMVANLSANKKGWDDRIEEFSYHAETGQDILNELIFLVDEDTRSFSAIMDALRLPKSNEVEIANRKQAISEATQYAVQVPFKVMETCARIFDLAEIMIDTGNPNSVSDAGVAALCARAAIHGAYLNVQINCADINDETFKDQYISQGQKICDSSDTREVNLMKKTRKVIEG